LQAQATRLAIEGSLLVPVLAVAQLLNLLVGCRGIEGHPFHSRLEGLQPAGVALQAAEKGIGFKAVSGGLAEAAGPGYLIEDCGSIRVFYQDSSSAGQSLADEKRAVDICPVPRRADQKRIAATPLAETVAYLQAKLF